MFEIGFSEILIVAVIALLVLGPEKLPKAARYAGLWTRRARAQWYSVKAEFERELAQEELRRSLAEPLSGIATEASEHMRALGEAARAPFEAAAQDVQGVGVLRAATAHDPAPVVPQDPPAPMPRDPAPADPVDPPVETPRDPAPRAPHDPAAPTS